MPQEEQFEVRDLRDKDQYKIDDKFLNGYAKIVGIYAVGVYNSLCRHAEFKSQECWPSIETIAKELNIGRKKVIDSMKFLQWWKIVKKERIGKKQTNRYSLMHKRLWITISEVSVRDFTSPLQGLHIVPDRDFHSKDNKKKDNTRKDNKGVVFQKNYKVNKGFERLGDIIKEKSRI